MLLSTHLFATLLGAWLTTSASAQQDFIEMLRADARAEKVAVVTEAMELEESESERFWPIYREYELELSKLGDRRIALLKRYAENYEELGNDEIKDRFDPKIWVDGASSSPTILGRDSLT